MSRRAAARLESFGFDNVCVYIGAKQDWLAFDLPFEGSLDKSKTAGGAATKDVPVCAAQDTVAEARKRAEQADWQHCVVVNENRIVLGVFDRDGSHADENSPVERAIDPAPLTVRPSMTLKSAAEKMRHQKTNIAVVTNPDGKLIGVWRQNETK